MREQKKEGIRGFSRRRVEWLGGRIIELPLIPSSPRYPRVKRGKRSTEETARERDSGGGTEAKDKIGTGRPRGERVRMVARGSCAVAAVGWEPGERNRRDDNICIIFNARTSGLRGGRQPPPADLLLLLLPRLGLLQSSLPLSWSPSNPHLLPRSLLRPRFSVATL